MKDFDPFDPAIALWRQLGRADQCRFVDHLLVELGDMAPIPAFEDIRREADSWAAIMDRQTKGVYLLAIFDSLKPEERKTTAQFLTERSDAV